jgi:Na+/H+-dicarboxylate symporter
MSGMNRLGKIMISIVIVFAITALISGILAIVGALIFNPTRGLDAQAIKTILSQTG